MPMETNLSTSKTQWKMRALTGSGNSALSDVNQATKWWIAKAADRQSMVHSTAENGLNKSLEMLLSNKANVNTRRREDGFTPLHCAVQVSISSTFYVQIFCTKVL
jgi:hypothetical protein